MLPLPTRPWSAASLAAPAALQPAWDLHTNVLPDAGRRRRRWWGLAVLGLHLLLFWGLSQLQLVHEVVSKAAPIVVALIRPPSPAVEAAPVAARLAPPHAPRPLMPALPLPTIELAVAPPVASAAPAPPPTTPTPPAPAPVAVAMVPSRPTPPPPAVPVVQQPIETTSVQYLEAPVVTYPRLSRRNAESGQVMVRVLISDRGGAPDSVQVARSSGFPRLDEAALSAVRKARFKACVDNGRTVPCTALVPIQFELQP